MTSSCRIAARFEELANHLQNAGQHDEVVFDQNKICHSSHIYPFPFTSIGHQLISAISVVLPQLVPCPSECRLPAKNVTLDYLAEIFGINRLQRIVTACRLNFGDRENSPLTVRELEWLVVKAAEVYEDDLEELLQEIHSDSSKVRFLDSDETETLRDQFRDKRYLDQCTNFDIDKLFAVLIPIETLEQLFFNRVPKLDFQAYDSGKHFDGMQQRVYIYEKLRRSHHAEAEWSCMVAKRLVDREVPKGVVFRNQHGGFCKVHETVFGDGAYKNFLKHIGLEGKQHRNIVLYRGTRMLFSATENINSLFDDLRKNLGSKGPKTTYERTNALLSDPKQGFVETIDEPVEGIGMSLGATHLKRDAIQFGVKFEKLSLHSGPGIEEKSAKLYAERVNQAREKVQIIYYWEAEDCTHHFGEVHLGHECDPSKVDVEINILHDRPLTLERASELAKYPEGIMPIHTIAMAGIKLVECLSGSHCRTTALKQHSVIKLSNQVPEQQVAAILGHNAFLDRGWEALRRMATSILPFF